MTPPMDPMSFEAQVEMYKYADEIRRHAVRVIQEKKDLLRRLNDQRVEE